jgi:hypothetical protein
LKKGGICAYLPYRNDYYGYGFSIAGRGDEVKSIEYADMLYRFEIKEPFYLRHREGVVEMTGEWKDFSPSDRKMFSDLTAGKEIVWAEASNRFLSFFLRFSSALCGKPVVRLRAMDLTRRFRVFQGNTCEGFLDWVIERYGFLDQEEALERFLMERGLKEGPRRGASTGTSPSVSFVLGEDGWEPYSLNGHQHDVINAVWGDMWAELCSGEDKGGLHRDISETLGRRNISLPVHVHSPSDDEFYGRLYSAAAERKVEFPPRERFRIVTHPGTFRNGPQNGKGMPASANFLIPRQEADFLLYLRKEKNESYYPWLRHETAHIVQRVLPDIEEQDEKEFRLKYPVERFREEYNLSRAYYKSEKFARFLNGEAVSFSPGENFYIEAFVAREGTIRLRGAEKPVKVCSEFSENIPGTCRLLFSAGKRKKGRDTVYIRIFDEKENKFRLSNYYETSDEGPPGSFRAIYAKRETDPQLMSDKNEGTQEKQEKIPDAAPGRGHVSLRVLEEDHTDKRYKALLRVYIYLVTEAAADVGREFSAREVAEACGLAEVTVLGELNLLTSRLSVLEKEGVSRKSRFRFAAGSLEQADDVFEELKALYHNKKRLVARKPPLREGPVRIGPGEQEYKTIRAYYPPIVRVFTLFVKEGFTGGQVALTSPDIAQLLGVGTHVALNAAKKLHSIGVLEKHGQKIGRAYAYYMTREVADNFERVLPYLNEISGAAPYRWESRETLDVFRNKIISLTGEKKKIKSRDGPAITLIKKDGEWEYSELTPEQHDVINRAWERLWADLSSKEEILDSVRADIEMRLKEKNIKLDLNVHSPTRKKLFDHVYEIAEEDNVVFPRPENFRILTHPGTFREPESGEPRSVNFLIPLEERLFLDFLYKKDTYAYMNWIEHEMAHVFERLGIEVTGRTAVGGDLFDLMDALSVHYTDRESYLLVSDETLRRDHEKAMKNGPLITDEEKESGSYSAEGAGGTEREATKVTTALPEEPEKDVVTPEEFSVAVNAFFRNGVVENSSVTEQCTVEREISREGLVSLPGLERDLKICHSDDEKAGHKKWIKFKFSCRQDYGWCLDLCVYSPEEKRFCLANFYYLDESGAPRSMKNSINVLDKASPDVLIRLFLAGVDFPLPENELSLERGNMLLDERGELNASLGRVLKISREGDYPEGTRVRLKFYRDPFLGGVLECLVDTPEGPVMANTYYRGMAGRITHFRAREFPYYRKIASLKELHVLEYMKGRRYKQVPAGLTEEMVHLPWPVKYGRLRFFDVKDIFFGRKHNGAIVDVKFTEHPKRGMVLECYSSGRRIGFIQYKDEEPVFIEMIQHTPEEALRLLGLNHITGFLSGRSFSLEENESYVWHNAGEVNSGGDIYLAPLDSILNVCGPNDGHYGKPVDLRIFRDINHGIMLECAVKGSDGPKAEKIVTNYYFINDRGKVDNFRHYVKKDSDIMSLAEFDAVAFLSGKKISVLPGRGSFKVEKTVNTNGIINMPYIGQVPVCDRTDPVSGNGELSEVFFEFVKDGQGRTGLGCYIPSSSRKGGGKYSNYFYRDMASGEITHFRAKELGHHKMTRRQEILIEEFLRGKDFGTPPFAGKILSSQAVNNAGKFKFYRAEPFIIGKKYHGKKLELWFSNDRAGNVILECRVAGDKSGTPAGRVFKERGVVKYMSYSASSDRIKKFFSGKVVSPAEGERFVWPEAGKINAGGECYIAGAGIYINVCRSGTNKGRTVDLVLEADPNHGPVVSVFLQGQSRVLNRFLREDNGSIYNLRYFVSKKGDVIGLAELDFISYYRGDPVRALPGREKFTVKRKIRKGKISFPVLGEIPVCDRGSALSDTGEDVDVTFEFVRDPVNGLLVKCVIKGETANIFFREPSPEGGRHEVSHFRSVSFGKIKPVSLMELTILNFLKGKKFSALPLERELTTRQKVTRKGELNFFTVKGLDLGRDHSGSNVTFRFDTGKEGSVHLSVLVEGVKRGDLFYDDNKKIPVFRRLDVAVSASDKIIRGYKDLIFEKGSEKWDIISVTGSRRNILRKAMRSFIKNKVLTAEDPVTKKIEMFLEKLGSDAHVEVKIVPAGEMSKSIDTVNSAWKSKEGSDRFIDASGVEVFSCFYKLGREIHSGKFMAGMILTREAKEYLESSDEVFDLWAEYISLIVELKRRKKTAGGYPFLREEMDKKAEGLRRSLVKGYLPLVSGSGRTSPMKKGADAREHRLHRIFVYLCLNRAYLMDAEDIEKELSIPAADAEDILENMYKSGILKSIIEPFGHNKLFFQTSLSEEMRAKVHEALNLYISRNGKKSISSRLFTDSVRRVLPWLYESRVRRPGEEKRLKKKEAEDISPVTEKKENRKTKKVSKPAKKDFPGGRLHAMLTIFRFLCERGGGEFTVFDIGEDTDILTSEAAELLPVLGKAGIVEFIEKGPDGNDEYFFWEDTIPLAEKIEASMAEAARRSSTKRQFLKYFNEIMPGLSEKYAGGGSGIVLRRAGSSWEQVSLDRRQHRVVNTVWKMMWKRFPRMDKENFLEKEISNILSDNGISGIDINIFCPSEKELYDLLYAEAERLGAGAVFPPRGDLLLLTHPGTGSNGGRLYPRSVNLLVPKEVAGFLREEKEKHTSGRVVQSWAEHEGYHIVKKIKRNLFSPKSFPSDGDEKAVSSFKGVTDFAAAYLKEKSGRDALPVIPLIREKGEKAATVSGDSESGSFDPGAAASVFETLYRSGSFSSTKAVSFSHITASSGVSEEDARRVLSYFLASKVVVLDMKRKRPVSERYRFYLPDIRTSDEMGRELAVLAIIELLGTLKNERGKVAFEEADRFFLPAYRRVTDRLKKRRGRVEKTPGKSAGRALGELDLYREEPHILIKEWEEKKILAYVVQNNIEKEISYMHFCFEQAGWIKSKILEWQVQESAKRIKALYHNCVVPEVKAVLEDRLGNALIPFMVFFKISPEGEGLDKTAVECFNGLKLSAAAAREEIKSFSHYVRYMVYSEKKHSSLYPEGEEGRELLFEVAVPDSFDSNLYIFADIMLSRFIRSEHRAMGRRSVYVQDLLLEIMNNIVEHGKGGYIRVFGARQKDGKFSRIWITAQDEGPGLSQSPDKLVEWFFERVGAGRSKGIGLISWRPDAVTIRCGKDKWIRDKELLLGRGSFAHERTEEDVKGTRIELMLEVPRAIPAGIKERAVQEAGSGKGSENGKINAVQEFIDTVLIGELGKKQRQRKKTHIFLGTDWINGYEGRDHLHHSRINSLLVILRTYCAEHNIKLISGSDREVMLEMQKYEREEGAKAAALLSEDNAVSQKALRLAKEKNIQVTGVDASNLRKDGYVYLMDMLALMLKILYAQSTENLFEDIIEVRRIEHTRNCFVFTPLPPAVKLDEEEVARAYKTQQYILTHL